MLTQSMSLGGGLAGSILSCWSSLAFARRHLSSRSKVLSWTFVPAVTVAGTVIGVSAFPPLYTFYARLFYALHESSKHATIALLSPRASSRNPPQKPSSGKY
jgi:hypothetical protein